MNKEETQNEYNRLASETGDRILRVEGMLATIADNKAKALEINRYWRQIHAEEKAAAEAKKAELEVVAANESGAV